MPILKIPGNLLKTLSNWYNSRTKRQINVLRLTALLLSAIGWGLIAPWLIPLMLYMEYNFNPDDTD